MILGAMTEEVKFIDRQIRADFHHRYGDGESLRRNFFEQQNGLCILCNQSMQDWSGAFTQIEHMIPVRLQAEFYVSGWTLEQVLNNANDLKNLRLSHISCGVRKSDYDLEEIPENFFDSEQPRFLTEEEIQRRRERMRIGGRKGGTISGKRSVESGQWERVRNLPQTKAATKKFCGIEHMEWMRNLPQTKAAQRKQGNIRGRQEVESGHLEQIRNLPQTKAAQQEAGKKIGKIYGRRNVENGHMASIHSMGGKKAVESGQLASITTFETRSKGGKSSSHTRWHTRRGISNPACPFCLPSLQQATQTNQSCAA